MADDFARLLDSVRGAGKPLDAVDVIDVDAAVARAREVLDIVRGWPKPLAHDLLDGLREIDPALDELLILEGDPTAPDVRGILPAGRPIPWGSPPSRRPVARSRKRVDGEWVTVKAY